MLAEEPGAEERLDDAEVVAGFGGDVLVRRDESVGDDERDEGSGGGEREGRGGEERDEGDVKQVTWFGEYGCGLIHATRVYTHEPLGFDSDVGEFATGDHGRSVAPSGDLEDGDGGGGRHGGRGGESRAGRDGTGEEDEDVGGRGRGRRGRRVGSEVG